jgi:AbrB family looped-hinge helix DNA binding protein
MASARVNSKGEITLPKSVLERLGVKAGDQLEFVEYARASFCRDLSHTTFGH